MILLEKYLKEPIYFLRTVTLKNKYFADQMLANDVNETYQSALPDKYNPYYRHLNGEYVLSTGTTEVSGVDVPNSILYTKHDTLMTVMSLDTQQEIAFTKANLATHPKTAAWYRMPNSYYFKLCDRYPTQTDLIKSIVYPVEDIDAAIEADNFTILNYDESQLQDNEYVTVIAALNRVLDMIRTRWDVKEFTYEDMFAIVQQGLIWDILYYTIIVQRVKNIRTSAVHEWHLWEYLKSHGLSDYRDVLSFKQALFLYKNIDYLLKHKGTNNNFSILIGALLSELNVSLYTKSLVQSTKSATSDEDSLQYLNHTVIEEIVDRVTRDTSSGTSASDTSSSQATVEVDDTVSLNQIFGNTTKPAVRILSTTSGDDYLIKQAQAFVKGTSKEANNYSSNMTTAILKMSEDSEQENNVNRALTGTVESLDYTFKKEQESELEYVDDNLFTTSTDKQDLQFPVTPHTILTTKAHEINKNIKSALFEEMYAKFMTESYLYRCALGNLNGINVVVGLSETAEITMSAKNAIALAMYCVAKEYGITLERPPYAVDLYFGYKETFPDLPTTFKFHNKVKRVDSYLAQYAFKDMIPRSSETGFVNITDLAETMDSQAQNFLGNYIQVHSSASSIHYEILAKVYEQRTIHGRYYITLLDEASTTFAEFFEDHEDIKYIFESYDEATDSLAMYSEAYTKIIEALFPITSKYLTSDSINDSYVFNRIKQLFISMCSYNVTFFDKAIDATNPTTTFWLQTQELLKQSNKKFIRYWFQIQDDYWKFITREYLELGPAFGIEPKGPNSIKYGFSYEIPKLIEDQLVSKSFETFVYSNGMELGARLYPIHHAVIGEQTYNVPAYPLIKTLNTLIADTDRKGVDIYDYQCMRYLVENGYATLNKTTYPDNVNTFYLTAYNCTFDSTKLEDAKTLIKTILANINTAAKCYRPKINVTKQQISHGVISDKFCEISGSVTPVYDGSGNLKQVIIEKSHDYDEVQDYQIVDGVFSSTPHGVSTTKQPLTIYNKRNVVLAER